MRIPVEDARTLGRLLLEKAYEADATGEAVVELAADDLRKLDDAARAELQAAIESAGAVPTVTDEVGQ